MMYRVLYIDDTSDIGTDRFRALARSLAPDVLLQFVDALMVPAGVTPTHQWDLFIADLRGLAAPQRDFIEHVVESNPDAAVVLVTESLDPAAADATWRYGAIDCVTWRRGSDSLAESVRRTLSRLAMTRRAIRSMNSRIEEFDVTLAIGPSPKSASSLARYTLRHIARMDVCGLRNQFRAIRAFEEALEKSLQSGWVKPAEPPVVVSDRAADSASDPSDVDRSTGSEPDPTVAQVRIHLSRDGLRFTLHSNGPVPLKPRDGRSASGDAFAPADGLWFAPLFMDEISVDQDHGELTMLMLPDEVCRDVSQAIACRHNTDQPKQDVLGEFLKVVEVRDGHDLFPEP